MLFLARPQVNKDVADRVPISVARARHAPTFDLEFTALGHAKVFAFHSV